MDKLSIKSVKRAIMFQNKIYDSEILEKSLNAVSINSWSIFPMNGLSMEDVIDEIIYQLTKMGLKNEKDYRIDIDE